jgi:glycosyltransferase involved in cell wall biosynthesis
MNILFLMKNFKVGGIEVVSNVLAQTFVEHGHKAAIFTFKEPTPMMQEQIPAQVKLFVRHDMRISRANINALRKVLVDEKIDVIINQWGLPFAQTLIAQIARRGLNIKYISVYHNSPDTNARIQDVNIALQQTSSLWKRCLLKTKLKIVSAITRQSMRYVYRQSDYYILLSPSFVEKFCTFCHLPKEAKLITIPNPLTLPEVQCVYREELKRKQVIYMGRMDHNQKRVSRVIDVWEKLYKRFPDWELHFVGDGHERKTLEQSVKDRGLTQVHFDGFCHPIPFYQTGTILIQTSEYEGFPLVLAESMCFGVVPVVYGSYSAVYDIIKNKQNGIICPYTPTGFDADIMAEAIAWLMKIPDERIQMACQAAQTKKNFTTHKIYQSWETILKA